MLAHHQKALSRLSNVALRNVISRPHTSNPYQGALWQDCRRHLATSKRAVSANLLSKKDTGRNVAWTQDEGSLCIGVEVADDVRGKDVNLEVHPRRMKLEIQQKLVIEGPFPAAVKPDGSFFSMETADKSKLCLITLEKQEVSADRWVELFEDEELDTSITDKAFMDISIGEDGEAGEPERVELGLYGTECPKTVENFLALCEGSEGVNEAGQPMHYKGCSFHRIIKNFMVQGGDFTKGDGTGGESIYGRTFPDESTRVKHDEPMKLCMANAGPDTNGSQFYITFVPCPHLDGNHVVFGEVIGGEDVIKRIESEAGSADGDPVKPVTITDCGVLDRKAKETEAEETPVAATATRS